METVYYTTRNFIRHQGNLVDLNEYRRRLAQVEGSCAIEAAFQPIHERQEEALPQKSGRKSVRGRKRHLADWLELTATVMTVALIATVLVQFWLI